MPTHNASLQYNILWLVVQKIANTSMHNYVFIHAQTHTILNNSWLHVLPVCVFYLNVVRMRVVSLDISLVW